MAFVDKKIWILVCCMFFLFACENKKQEEVVLFDFENESVFEEVHWKCHTLFSLSDMHAARGNKSLKLEMFPSPYPGISPALKHNDWHEYKVFGFNVYNPGKESVNLVVRIDDKKDALEYSDRYNKSFEIAPGANMVEIPMKTLKTSISQRPLNLKNIYRFLVFMSHPDKKHILYFDYFRLMPEEKDTI